MSHNTNLSFRFALLIFGRFLLLLLGLVTTSILTRHLGPEGFGNYRAAVAYLGLIVVLADLGLGSIFVREISRKGADQAKIVGSALTLRLVISFVIMLFAVLLTYLLPFSDSERFSIQIGALGFVAYSIHLFLFGLFQQKLKQQGVVIAEISGGLILLASIVALSTTDAEPFWFVGSLGFSYIFTLLITFLFAKRLVVFKMQIELKQWRKLVSAALPLAGASTVLVLYIRSDSVLLALLHSTEAVGIYGVPLKISDSYFGIALLFVGLFAPLFARAASNEREKFIKLLNDAYGIIFLGSVGAAVIFNVLAKEIILLLAGPDYLDGVLILRLLTVFMVLHSGSLLLREAAVALDIQAKLFVGYVLAAVIAFLSYYYLIPVYAGAGAAGAIVISEIFLSIYVYCLVSKGISKIVSLRVPVLGIISGLSSLVYFYFIIQTEWNWIERLIVAVVAYLSMLLISRALSPSMVIPFVSGHFKSQR